jgi:NADH dehydrogenase
MGAAKVIIIGGGFGGLNAAQALKKADVELTLIDKTNLHLFQPLLYQVATAAVSPGDIAAPIREVLAKQANATVLMANITSIDKVKKQIVAENGDRFPYDYLILAPGATHSYFSHSEWERWAPGLKTITDAITIRERVLLSYERAERCPAEAEKFMTFVIVGGGPTGVEMAGAIAEMAHKTLVNDFRYIKSKQSRIYLVEGCDQILPSYPKKLAGKAQRDLEKLGVQVVLSTFVTNVTEKGVEFGGRFLETPNVIWAAGNEASPLLKTLGVPLDRNKRVIVNPDLTIPEFPDVFVIGDAACNYAKDGVPLPGVAQVAIQQGRYVAKLIRKNVPVNERKPFVYFNKGMMATIGKAKAIAVIGKMQISGFVAWMAWCFIHITFLITFSNKLLVMIEWFLLYVSNQRRIRLITRPITEEDNPLHNQDKQDAGKESGARSQDSGVVY